MSYSEIYINRIKYFCKKRKISVAKLAQMSNISQTTLANIMTGASKCPRVDTMHKIANALNMTLAEFLNFEELNNYSFDDEENE